MLYHRGRERKRTVGRIEDPLHLTDQVSREDTGTLCAAPMRKRRRVPICTTHH